MECTLRGQVLSRRWAAAGSGEPWGLLFCSFNENEQRAHLRFLNCPYSVLSPLTALSICEVRHFLIYFKAGSHVAQASLELSV